MATLSELQERLLSLLADADDTAGWDERVTEEAIRRGLRSFRAHAPVVEASVTITGTGYEVDLSSQAVDRVLAVAYPWHDGDCFDRHVIAWRMVSDQVVRCDAVEFQAGDLLRLRYRQRYLIEDLDGATTTTVEANNEDTLLLACAHHAYILRLRQLARRPSSPESDIETCETLAQTHWQQFMAAVSVSRTNEMPAWSHLGL